MGFEITSNGQPVQPLEIAVMAVQALFWAEVATIGGQMVLAWLATPEGQKTAKDILHFGG